MSTKVLRLAWAVVLSALIAVSLAPVRASAQTRMVRVLIGFSQAASPEREAAIGGLGGVLGRRFHRFPMASAQIPERMLPMLERLSGVSFVEEDVQMHTMDQTVPWGINMIGALTAQESNTGTGVKVAVIDTGIQLDHPDLNVVGNVTFVSGTPNADDDNGHGSHVAGTIAAVNNSVGVIGVAPDVQLYAVKVLGSGGTGYTSDIIAGIEWSIDNGMQVINMSFGSATGTTGLKDACDAAYNAGVVVVAAAGNNGSSAGTGDNVIYPANYDSVIAVAAVDNTKARASFSSTGPGVELAAPGVNIYSTTYNASYTNKSGTSMASPHVAGLAALIIASGIADANGNGRINDEVRQRMDQTAEDLGSAGRDPLYGYGLVRADLAVWRPPSVTTNAATNIANTSARLNGNLSSLGTASSANVSFEYGLTTSYGSATSVQTMTATGSFNADISGLSPNNLYHFRARAAGQGAASGSDVLFTTSSSPPTVTTSAATNVATTSARLNGNLGSLGTAASVSVSFEYGPTTSYGSTTGAQAMTGTGTFNADVSGLAPNTLYHFRARAVGHGTANGSDLTFTTSSTPPSVTTSAATSIGATSAHLNGNLGSLGTAASVSVSFEYGLTTSYGSTTGTQAMTGTGDFGVDISGLTANTLYHFRAKAVGHGTANGSDLTFTTSTTPPSVTTSAAGNVATTSARLNGNLSSLGTASSVSVSFEYGLTTGYGSTTSVQTMTATGTFGADISGLAPNTLYHFRAKAVGQGTANGSDLTFTTSTTPPTVTTSAATNLGPTSARLNGNLGALGTAGSVSVSFEYGLTAGYGSTTGVQTMSAIGGFSADISGLAPNTLYHFRARAVGQGSASGGDLTFTTLLGQVAVSTGGASNLAAISARLNGDLASLGAGTSANVSFEYGLTTSYGSVTAVQTMSAIGAFSADIGGLSPDTLYHFRALAEGDGQAAGADLTFTTLPGQLTVRTDAASIIGTVSARLNGTLVSLGMAASANVSFEYGLTASYGSTTAVQTRSAAGAFNADIAGLSPNTVYHFRATAIGEGTANGSDLTLTTATTPPSVTTSASGNIATTSARLNGTLGSLGTATSANVSFEYGLTTSYGSTTAAQTMSAIGGFNADISGLSPNTVYHFRARAVGHGSVNGGDLTFTTSSTPPTVTTSAATNVAATSARLNGDLGSLGTAGSVSVSFEYGLTAGYGSTTGVQTMTAIGGFSADISGLSPNTLYHFRARAVGQGSANGADLTFTTSSTPPTVTTSAATNVATTSARLNGNLGSLGTAGSVSVSFEYGLTAGYGSTTGVQTMSAIGGFNADISGLSPNTLYHFRARAVGHGSVNGGDLTFTTTSTPPTVTTSAATNVATTSARLNGNLGSLGTAGSVSVSFEYGLTASYGSTTGVQTMSAIGGFNADISGLSPNTLYHFRARAVGHGSVNGGDLTFTTSFTPPSVTTTVATNIGTTVARLNGNLGSLGTAGSVSVSFEYGLTTGYGSTTGVQIMSGTGGFSFDLDALTPNTVYHFRARATGQGTANGSDLSFTTANTPPTVTTNDATNIGPTSARLNGNLGSLGTASSVSVFFEYGLTTNYGSITNVQATSAIGSFNADITGLSANTLYHFRARAAGQGTANGSDLTFTTLTIPPSVTTNAATNIGTTSVRLNGNLGSLGTAASANVSFEYGLTAGYGSVTPVQTVSAVGGFNADISGLTPNTLYHFRARATGHGTTVASDLTFTTLPIPPSVTTNAATNVGTTSARLNGNLGSLGTAASADASFEYGLTTGYGSVTPAQTMSAAGGFSADISGLSPNTSYHFRARATGHGTANGSDFTFTTSTTPPSVTTNAASNIGTGSVHLNGNLGSLGTAASANVSFEYGLTASYGSLTPVQTMSATGDFGADISGLTPNTLYHFRARAAGQGTASGSDYTFKTSTTPPTVTTSGAGNIGTGSASLNGNLGSLGTAGSVSVSFEYGLTTGYGSVTGAQTVSATGNFSSDMSGLSPNTLYHFRARAVGDGTANGSDLTFTTLSTPPSVTTNAATSVGSASARLNGNLASLGTSTSVSVSFEYGPTASYGSVTSVLTVSAAGDFGIDISSLTANALYHFRARAVGQGTASGDDRTFTTTSGGSTGGGTTGGSGGFGGGGGFGGAPPPRPIPTPGVLDLTGIINADGVFTQSATATSADGVVQVAIGAASVGKTADGKPLDKVSVSEMLDASSAPAEWAFVGKVYTLGPDGAAFDPPATLILSYDPRLLPPGATVKNLFLAAWDAVGKQWTALDRSNIDSSLNAVSAPISHFSSYAVMARVRPATLAVSNLRVSPAEVESGQTAGIQVTVSNTGDLAGSYNAVLRLNGAVVATRDASVSAGGSVDLAFETVQRAPGAYAVDIGGLSGKLVVREVLAPAAFSADGLSVSPFPPVVRPGDAVSVSIVITNRGGTTGTFPVSLKINGVTEDGREIALAAGASQTVSFSTSRILPGSYTIDIAGLSGAFTVEAEPAAKKSSTTGWWVVAAIILCVTAVATGLVAARRRRTAVRDG